MPSVIVLGERNVGGGGGIEALEGVLRVLRKAVHNKRNRAASFNIAIRKSFRQLFSLNPVLLVIHLRAVEGAACRVRSWVTRYPFATEHEGCTIVPFGITYIELLAWLESQTARKGGSELQAISRDWGSTIVRLPY